MNEVNVLIIGGSGRWADKTYYSAILSEKKNRAKVRVRAICDPVNPREPQPGEVRHNLPQIIKSDDPLWIDPTSINEKQLLEKFTQLKEDLGINAVIIACNPSKHHFYGMWALHNRLNSICDKPSVATPNASFDSNQAKKLEYEEREFTELYNNVKSVDPRYIFCYPLRLRALTPYTLAMDSLADVFQRTQQHITYVNIVVNNGIHKLPAEYLKGGAHGHLDGIGTLSHTSYHFIDMLAWCIQGYTIGAYKVIVNLNHISRVKDYIDAKGYDKLLQLIDPDSDAIQNIELPKAVLNSELDFNFSFQVLDKKNRVLMTASFITNNSSFGPRTVKYDERVTEYAHSPDGGRTASTYLDIHQGALQQITINKNRKADDSQDIYLCKNLHPHLGTERFDKVFTDAYKNSEVTVTDLVRDFLKHCEQQTGSGARPRYQTPESQALTEKIYIKMYQLMAKQYEQPVHSPYKLEFEI